MELLVEKQLPSEVALGHPESIQKPKQLWSKGSRLCLKWPAQPSSTVHVVRVLKHDRCKSEGFIEASPKVPEYHRGQVICGKIRFPIRKSREVTVKL